MVNAVINKERIKFSLELMNIIKGDIILVHSALSSMGYVDGGAATVIDALLETVGEEGTVVMSSLTGWSDAFDSTTTPSAVGRISEEFRKRNGAVRSLHPVHSIVAIGKQAKFITDDHEKCETGCGTGTPYLKLRDLEGKVILLGVDMDRNTIMHSIEEEINLLYLRTLAIPAPSYISDYRNKTFTLQKFPPGHRDFIGLTPFLRQREAIIEGKIGSAAVKVMSIKRLFEIGLDILRRDPLFFICNNPNCNSCHWSRMLYGTKKIDYSRYKGNGCADTTCEICVV